MLRSKVVKTLCRVLLSGIVLVLLCGGSVLISRHLSVQMQAETLKSTEQAIRRAAVQCYALEGAYPVSLEYLKQHYGVTVDGAHIYVDYFYVAANLAPDITVLPIE